MPPLPVQYNVHQLLSMQLTTVQGNVSSVNIHKYANVKKQTPPYLPKLNQQQQSEIVSKFPCPLGCGKIYRQNKNLQYHMKYECGKEPRFQCPYCVHRTKRKNNLMLHIASQHGDKQ